MSTSLDELRKAVEQARMLIDILKAENERLRADNERLKGALAFYADEMNWLPPKGHEYAPSPSQRDWGKTARKALAGETT